MRWGGGWGWAGDAPGRALRPATPASYRPLLPVAWRLPPWESTPGFAPALEESGGLSDPGSSAPVLDSCLPGPGAPLAWCLPSHPSVDTGPLMRGLQTLAPGAHTSLFGLGLPLLGGCCRPPPHRPRPLGGPEWPELSWEPRERLVRGRAGCPDCLAWAAGEAQEQGPGSEIGTEGLPERWGRGSH